MLNLRRFALLASSCAVVLLCYPRAGHTHEPITTKVMFNKEIIRILDRNCLGCHAPGRIKADIPLTTYEEARPWAKAIKEEVLEKRMMPYQAVKGYGSFQHDYTLPQREVELLVSWIEGGAPRGEAKDYPPQLRASLHAASWKAGQPDLILQPEAEAKIAAEGEDETRCFTLPTGLRHERHVSQIEFQPGNPAVVHSASFFLAHKGTAQMSKAVRRVGEACEANAESLGEWVPGQALNRLPSSAGRLLPAGASIVLKIRYRKNGAAALDRSRLGFYFAKEPINKTVRAIAIRGLGNIIPPNTASHRVKALHIVNEATEAIAVRPLLFPFAKSIEVAVHRPDGTVEVLIWAQNYHFDWQPSYYFKKPVALPKGTRLEVTAYLDNSENNAKHPHDAAKPLGFAEALCELVLAHDVQLKTASRR